MYDIRIIRQLMLDTEPKEVVDMLRKISKLCSLNTDAINTESLMVLIETDDCIEFYKDLIAWRYVALQRLLRKKKKFLNGCAEMSDEDFVQACIKYYYRYGKITVDDDVFCPLENYDAIIQAGKKFSSADVLRDKNDHFNKYMRLTGKSFGR